MGGEGGGGSGHDGRLKLEVDRKMTVETGGNSNTKAYRGWLSKVFQSGDGGAELDW